jgi:uncharacterized protein with NRDE domain
MCLALLALGTHSRYAVVIAANRDEFHARAAAPAAWWKEGCLAGRDLAAGGTWFGVTRAGRWALVTNIREPGRHDPSAPSRGALVPNLLANAAPVADGLGRIVASAERQNGFNLVAGSGGEAHWGSNRVAEHRSLEAGIYGLSNATLDTPWPKVKRTKAGLADWCAQRDTEFELLFELLGDKAPASDDELPMTGLTLERERLLSAPFIVSSDYGTRCSTVLAIDHDGNARFTERSFDPAGRVTVEVDERFRVAP